MRLISICTALVALGSGAANAQDDAVLHRVRIPGATFDLVFALGKQPSNIPNPVNQLGSRVVYLVDGRIAVAVNGQVEQEFNVVDYRHFPTFAFEVHDLT